MAAIRRRCRVWRRMSAKQQRPYRVKARKEIRMWKAVREAREFLHQDRQEGEGTAVGQGAGEGQP